MKVESCGSQILVHIRPPPHSSQLVGSLCTRNTCHGAKRPARAPSTLCMHPLARALSTLAMPDLGQWMWRRLVGSRQHRPFVRPPSYNPSCSLAQTHPHRGLFLRRHRIVLRQQRQPRPPPHDLLALRGGRRGRGRPRWAPSGERRAQGRGGPLRPLRQWHATRVGLRERGDQRRSRSRGDRRPRARC